MDHRVVEKENLIFLFQVPYGKIYMAEWSTIYVLQHYNYFHIVVCL